MSTTKYVLGKNEDQSVNSILENTPDLSSILHHIAQHITLSEQDKEWFISMLRIKKVKRKQFLEQPGFVSTYRTYVVAGAFRAYFVGPRPGAYPFTGHR